ncbi:MAG: methyltransferase domain-containing protein [Anaerolineae bacterium]
MHLSTLERLLCPDCRGPLRLVEATAWQGKAAVQRGTAGCVCGARYAIRSGILDFRPSRHGITPAQWTNHFAPTAWGYERFWRLRSLTQLSGEPFPLAREAQVMLEMMQPDAPGLYVDLACSTALQARILAAYWRERGLPARVLAVDFAWPMLREAASLIRREGWETIDLVCADTEQLPLPDGSVAAIACGGSLNEFRDASVVLAEARRVARDGGRSAFMSLLSGDKGPRGLEQVLSESSGIRFYSLAQTRRLFETAEWDVVQQAAWGRVLFSEIRPILNKPYINS